MSSHVSDAPLAAAAKLQRINTGDESWLSENSPERADQPTLRRELQPPAALRAVGVLCIAAVLAVMSLWLFSRNNDFPLDYHPDEYTKVNQLIDPAQPRNFNHPLLMLETANTVKRLAGIPSTDSHDVVVFGRWISAGLATIAVIAFALAGFVTFGFRGLLVCGLTLGLCPPLLVHAHYFKEDTSLIAGIAIAVLGAAIMTTKRSSISAQLIAVMILAIGCGVSASAKYVGAVVIVPCLLAILLAPIRPIWLTLCRPLLFVIVAAASILMINARAFDSFSPPHLKPAALARFNQEYSHGLTGQNGIALKTPNVFTISVSISEAMPHLWAFIVAGIVATILWRRRISRWSIVLTILMATFVTALSYSTVAIPRYALPITVLLYFIAAQMLLAATEVSSVTVGNQSRVLAWRPRRGLTTLILGASIACVVLFQGARALNFDHQFGDDSRQRLREWTAKNIPRRSVVVAEVYTGLGGTGNLWRFPDQSMPSLRLRNPMFACDLGESDNSVLQDLVEGGVRYVAIAEPAYGRFFNEDVRALPDARPLASRKKFYTDLAERGTLVWSSAPSPPTHSYVNPEIRVYSVGPSK